MKLEDQVTNLELSKKLKELGVKQESLFYWVYMRLSGAKIETKEGYSLWYEDDLKHLNEQIGIKIQDVPKDEIYSAFTVAELGEMLPDETRSEKAQHIQSREPQWIVEPSEGSDFEDIGQSFIDDTEANARAKMLIYLIENKLV